MCAGPKFSFSEWSFLFMQSSETCREWAITHGICNDILWVMMMETPTLDETMHELCLRMVIWFRPFLICTDDCEAWLVSFC
jgi:hypothetical protein